MATTAKIARTKDRNPPNAGSVRKKPFRPASTQANLLRLHRTQGNRAVGRMLQAANAPTEPETTAASGIHRQEDPEPASLSPALDERASLQTESLTDLGVQAKLEVSRPGDPYEREADRVARNVVANLGRVSEPEEVRAAAVDEEVQTVRLFRRAERNGNRVDADTESEIARARGGGSPLADEVRRPMERSFGADFSAVRVHSDSRADRLNRTLHARAFTLGSEIFFRAGHYRPATAAGKELLAHELTHVVQQTGPGNVAKTAATTPEPPIEETPRISRLAEAPLVQSGWFDWLEEKARKAAEWARKKAEEARDYAARKIREAKEYVLSQLENLPGYVFVLNLMGANPITGQKAGAGAGPALKSVLSFMGLQEMLNNLTEAKVFEKAWTLFKTAFEEAGLTGAFIAESFKNISQNLSVNPVTWKNAVTAIKDFLVSLVAKAVKVGCMVVPKLPGLVLEGFLVLVGAPVKKIWAVLNQGKDVIGLIAGDPRKFAGNLMSAVGQGFTLFKDNILTHLKTGLFIWLFGTLAKEGGLQMPEKFNLKGIFSLVVQLLGLGYSVIRTLLVGILGEKTVARLEAAWDFLKLLVTEGLSGLWNWAKEKLGGLKERLLEAIQGWVITKLVATGIDKLILLASGPIGGVVAAVKAVYNLVVLFIEKANMFAALIGKIFESISSIAHGKVESAAKLIEKALGFTIPVTLSLLASVLGIGDIGAGIKKAITDIREWLLGLLKKAAHYIAEKAGKWLGKGKEGLGKIAKWWGFKNRDGHEHKAFFEHDGEDMVPMVASLKMPLKKYVADLKNTIEKDTSSRKAPWLQQLAKVEQIQGELKTLKTKQRWSKSENRQKEVLKYSDWDDSLGSLITQKMTELANALSLLPEPKRKGKIIRPPSEIKYGGTHQTDPVGDMKVASQDGIKATAEILSIDPGGHVGYKATHNSELFLALGKKRGAEIEAGHLLNHHLYGKGDKENIVPMTKSANAQMRKGPESKLQKIILENNGVAAYTVEAKWPTNIDKSRGPFPEDAYLPEKIEFFLMEKEFKYDDFKNANTEDIDHAKKIKGNWGDKELHRFDPIKIVPGPDPNLKIFEIKKKLAEQAIQDNVSWTDFYRSSVKHDFKQKKRLSESEVAELEKMFQIAWRERKAEELFERIPESVGKGESFSRFKADRGLTYLKTQGHITEETIELLRTKFEELQKNRK